MAAIPHHRFPGIMWRLLHLITAFPENLRQQIYPGSRDPGYFPRTLSGENSGESLPTVQEFRLVVLALGTSIFCPFFLFLNPFLLDI